jgi:hypothetical protein
VSPNALGSLVLVSDGTATTQTEIADAINRDQSTISTYFQTLTIETADLALVERPNQCYSVTETGEKVIELVADLSGTDLASIDWGSAAEKEQIGTLLAPLYNSRSVAPFFVLNSLRNRRASHRPVLIDDIVRDVKNRVQEIDETTSKKRIDQIIERFITQNVVTIDDDRLTLIQKGGKNARLLHQLAEIVDRQVTSDTDGAGSSIDLSEIISEMRRTRMATALSLETVDNRLFDDSHFYHKLKRLDVLDTPNNEWKSLRWLTIENVGTEPTSAVLHKESGENKIYHEDMDLEVFLDGPDGQRLEVKNLVDHQPSFEQKVKILFPHPLPPGETLTLYYRMSWPNELSFYAGELMQSISLTRYTCGVGELQFGVVDTVDHAGVDCRMAVDDGKAVDGADQRWRRVSAMPESVVADRRPTLSPIHGVGYEGHLYTIESPRSPAYRIHYTPVC